MQTPKHIRGAYLISIDEADEHDDLWGGIYELSKDLIRRLSVKVVNGKVVLPTSVERCFKDNAKLEPRDPKQHPDEEHPDEPYEGESDTSVTVGIIPWKNKIIVRAIDNSTWSETDERELAEYKMAVQCGKALETCADIKDKQEFTSAQELEAEKSLPPGSVSLFLGEKPKGKKGLAAKKMEIETRRKQLDETISKREKEDPYADMPALAKDPEAAPVKGGRRTRRRKHKRGTRRHK